MSQNGVGERQGLGQSVRSQARYGYGTTVTSNTSTKKVPMKSQSSSYIKHIITSTDTLMGIALKYTVSVEQIKRENKMWTNDSLFLREHLLIPLTADNEKTVPKDLIVVSDRDRSVSNPEKDAKTSKSDVSGMDFLNKYDSTIAQLKTNVSKMEQNARFLEGMEDPNPLSAFRRTPPERQRSISFEDPHSPVLVIRSHTQSRRVQDSIDNARKADDELYEL
ncbi:lysM and putative peptidoglycan-binding domain-containing protein 2-like isoform X1 [Haliotis rufescens]|uniref:lysM and putative peptidoglycan-binding domain-containing protein 2-like isoform X1 n=1 Tax=Haliotis rufescens TaxID=6454 RepID=UPI00201F99EB|nr:lysM and putative peptidoglycan-binding domain-containing protein 2-like isoform X1 [Haliotis rufescens]